MLKSVKSGVTWDGVATLDLAVSSEHLKKMEKQQCFMVVLIMDSDLNLVMWGLGWKLCRGLSLL